MTNYEHYNPRIRRVRIILTVIIFVITLVSVTVAQVTPTSTWSAFYSSNTLINGTPVPVGTMIQAFDPQGIICGEFLITEQGSYGYLYVYGDDMTTPDVDEGAEPGDMISFTIDGIDAEVSAPAVWATGTPGGLFEIDLGISAPVGVNDDGEMPNKFFLEQNFPNPFNPETSIGYSLPYSEKVSLTIYNILGQEIRRWDIQGQPAGNHRIAWDASNEASGIYFYQLIAGEFVQRKKMLLLK